jgi:hypothetical protein
VIFTIWTNQNYAFSRIGNHCVRPKVDPIPFKQWHVVAAVSHEIGLEAYMIHKYSVDSSKFLRIIPSLKRNGTNFVLFGDNASWHKSKKVNDRLIKEGIQFIYNIVCYPIFNSIERVFFFVKVKFKQLKLQQSLEGKDIDWRGNISKSFE